MPEGRVISMKMTIAEIIKKSSIEEMAKLIGSVVAMQAFGISADEAIKIEYKELLKILQFEIEVDYKPTNANLIRSMSDEELALNMMCPNENGLGEIGCDKSANCNCYECILNWLQSEVEE